MKKKDALVLSLIAIVLALSFVAIAILSFVRSGKGFNISTLGLTGGCLVLALIFLGGATWMLRSKEGADEATDHQDPSDRVPAALRRSVRAHPLPPDVKRLIAEMKKPEEGVSQTVTGDK